jgi:DNA-binding NarL/FixJ family response regulator
MRKHRLVFVDENELTRTVFSYVLEGSWAFEIVGEASDYESAMTLTRQFAPDAIIIGYDLPAREDYELRTSLREEFPQVRIIELSDLDKAVSNKLTGPKISSFQHSSLVH